MAVNLRPTPERESPSLSAYLRDMAEREKASLMAQMSNRPQEDRAPETPQSIAPGLQGGNGMASPLDQSYRVSQGFGNYNPGLYQGRTAGARHYGLDVATPEGTPVKSPFSGIVKVGKSKDFGNYVEVRAADGSILRFSHLRDVDDLARQLGQAGREIQAGQRLGFTGSTGYSTAPHLDIMYQRQGRWVNPLEFEPLKRTLGQE